MDEEQAVINRDGIFRGFGMRKFFAMIVCIMLAAGALAGELLIAKEALRDGLWDLIVTATSTHSRNNRCGR